jgi:ribosomal protein S18 acetylase RimI-like enzyme
MAEVGDIRLAAYVRGGFLSADSGYAPTLRGLGADGNGEVLVATAPGSTDAEADASSEAEADAGAEAGAHGEAERIIGTIMLQPWPHAGEVVTGPHEAEIRALAVRPEAQGQGVGRRLLRQLMGRASERGISHLVLCTTPEMRTAHHLYEQEGFVRLPERDWSPHPGDTLLVYGLHLDGARTARPGTADRGQRDPGLEGPLA